MNEFQTPCDFITLNLNPTTDYYVIFCSKTGVFPEFRRITNVRLSKVRGCYLCDFADATRHNVIFPSCPTKCLLTKQEACRFKRYLDYIETLPINWSKYLNFYVNRGGEMLTTLTFLQFLAIILGEIYNKKSNFFLYFLSRIFKTPHIIREYCHG